ncbi:hypothetical protein M405DRAFT_283189 [Rhizopogon salebrosus TDB-379]|nr:hypothetical protein M405DRAFT_283189 [Rhizopogon salebrosus TDB-379]
MLEPAATMVPLVSVPLEDRYLGPALHTPYVVDIDASISKANGTTRTLRLTRTLLFGPSLTASLDSPGAQCNQFSVTTANSGPKSNMVAGCPQGTQKSGMLKVLQVPLVRASCATISVC